MPRNIFYYNLNKERFSLTLKCGQIVGSKLKFENKKNFAKNYFFQLLKVKSTLWGSNSNSLQILWFYIDLDPPKSL